MPKIANYLSITSFILLLLITNSSGVRSQEISLAWEEPANLSRSGSASSPKQVIDQEGQVHVLWQDQAVNSYMYVQGRPGEWSSPRAIEIPFGSRANYPNLSDEEPTPLFDPYLLADNNGQIHAFWLDERGRLYYSSVPATQISQYEQWTPQIQLAASSPGFTAAVDNAGGLHLGYLRNLSEENFPAGVYFRQLGLEDENWTNSKLIYGSPYFQNMLGEQANINLALSEGDGAPMILLTWDNPAEELVFLSSSVDGGINWNELTVVDRRQEEDSLSSAGPSKIDVAANGESLLLIWQAGHGFDNCSQYYQWSDDGGESWHDPAQMLDDFTGCPSQNEFVVNTGEYTLLYVNHLDQPYLMAWDGQRWGDPQPQGITDFIHPETNRRIEFGCHQLTVFDRENLLLVGCGVEPNNRTADIWLFQKEVGNPEEWFPEPVAWTGPVEVASGIPSISRPQIAADSTGRIHAFWSQTDEDSSESWVIYYTFWQEGQWTPSIRVLPDSQEDQLQPQVAVGMDDRMMLTWVNGSGDAFFSQASADRAFIAADWSTPVQIPSPESGVTAPTIGIDPKGVIFVAYAVPINEDRGIYVTESVDEGRSWQPPFKLFDGYEAGWELVGPAKLAVTDRGIIHIQWTKDMFDAENGRIRSTGLYYAHSPDQGLSFSEPMLVDETTVIWNYLTSSNEIVHRFWQERQDSSSSAFHQYSVDNGQIWSSPVRVANTANPLDIAVDSSGQLHLLEASTEQLSYQVWNGSSWGREEGLEISLANEDGTNPINMSATVAQDQILSTLITGERSLQGEVPFTINLVSTWRALNIPETPLIIAAVPTAPPLTNDPTSEPAAVIPEVTVEPTSTSTPAPTATAPFIGGQETNPPLFGIDNDYIQWAIIAVPVGLFLLVVFFLVVRSKRSSKT